MNEQELRLIVRDAIARHGAGGGAPSVPTRGPDRQAAFARHASHGLFTLPAGADGDGPCIIEPSVACNHCGYCKSYGH